MAKQIVIDHVFKVFGDDPQEALALVRQGLSKQEVLARTGQSIGVFDAHLSIEAGEIFVVMGLSGSGKSTLVRLLNLLIEPSAGRILLIRRELFMRPHRRHACRQSTSGPALACSPTSSCVLSPPRAAWPWFAPEPCCQSHASNRH